jgi:hypothetical protein
MAGSDGRNLVARELTNHIAHGEVLVGEVA